MTNYFFTRRFFCRALWKIRMAKIKTHNKRPFPHSDCHFSSFHLLFSFSYFIFPDNHNHRFTKSHNKFTITIKITTQWMTKAFAPASEGCAPRVPEPGRQRGRAPPHRWGRVPPRRQGGRVATEGGGCGPRASSSLRWRWHGCGGGRKERGRSWEEGGGRRKKDLVVDIGVGEDKAHGWWEIKI